MLKLNKLQLSLNQQDTVDSEPTSRKGMGEGRGGGGDTGDKSSVQLVKKNDQYR